MMDYGSIKKFAKRVEEELERLDVVCLNAGLMAAKFEVSAYGWERDIQVRLATPHSFTLKTPYSRSSYQTNLLSTVYLSLLLLSKLLQTSKTASAPPVLELVSSGTHYQISLPPEARSATSPIEYFNSSATFRTFEQYSITKLFLQHCQTHLCHLFPSDPPPVSIITICPGAVETGISRELDGWLVGIGKRVVGPLIMKAPEQGARTYISGIGLGVEGHGKFWTADRIKEPAPLLQGKENERFGEKVWGDVLRILRRDVGEGELDEVLKRIERACSEEEV